VVYGLVGSALAAPVDKLDATSSGRIEFNSISPPNPHAYARLNLDNTKAVVVYGDLLMPKQIAASSRVPAVVLSHGSGGVHSSAYDVWGKELTAAGYAVFVVYSFAPRGVAMTISNQSLVDYSADVADALNALKLLATHPLIDAKRIFNIGFSRGGSTAFQTAWPTWQRPVDTAGAKFAGHVPMYQGRCNVRFRTDDRETATAPILMLMADRKNETGQSVELCIKYADQLAAKGNKITYKEYKGAYHGFDGMYPWSVNTQATSGIGCDMEVYMTLARDGSIGKDGFDFVANKPVLNQADWNAGLAPCVKLKTHITYGTKEFRDASVKDSLEFMNSIK
jgi:dienelactone hydrolase